MMLEEPNIIYLDIILLATITTSHISLKFVNTRRANLCFCDVMQYIGYNLYCSPLDDQNLAP